MLAVSDNGYGMDRSNTGADLRAVLHHEGVGQGNGLGLSTVYGIVKQSGGSIEVYSEPGNAARPSRSTSRR